MERSQFPDLLSPQKIGPVTIRNRIMFTGHDSLLQGEDGSMSDAYIAYQVARAKGGAGLIVLSGAAIDELSATTPNQLRIDTDAVIPGLRRMADAVHPHGVKLFAQLLQPGREIYSTTDGTLPVTYSSSPSPSERFRVLPREMSKPMIRQIIAAYAAAARRALEAGLDGAEVVGNQGNLPAQFLAAAINKRADEYGGSLENRMRFTLEVCRAIRAEIGDRIALGLRLSADDMDIGVTEDESQALCRALDQEGLVDYLSLVLGSAATRRASAHIVAPMHEQTGYVAPHAQRIKQAVRVPVMATGRFNTPQSAQSAIQNGQADVIGMTRAMICDPEIGRKVLEGRIDDIRACIGCVQACIGHYQKHAPVSCIQFPESGRELQYGTYPPIGRKKKVLVAGGGPAGMKAAAVAAARGHEVILCEAGPQLGGQAQLAQKLPTREEFGGIITNLEHEVMLAGVTVRRNTRVDLDLIARERPDAVILATGGRTLQADPETIEGAHVVTADEVVAGTATIGKRVVIADSRMDWVGIGVAERLAAEGHHVRLAVSGIQPGEFIPSYVRDVAMGRLFTAGVEVISYARFYGADSDTVYFQHITAQQPLVLEEVDTLVVCFGASADRALEHELEDLEIERHIIGDCLTPRTAEEAVLDGLRAGVAL